MITLSQKEFEKKYGKGAYTALGRTAAPQTNIFNTQAAKNVWVKASEDIAYASAQSRANQITGQGDPFLGAKTSVIQGGLAPFRSLGAGLFGEGTSGGGAIQSADIGQKLDTAGSFINKQILPKGTSEKIGQTALDTVTGFQNMPREKQLEQRNLLGIAEGLGGLLGARNPFELRPLKLNPADADYVINATDDVFESAYQAGAKESAKTADSIVQEAQNLRQSIQAQTGASDASPLLRSTASRLTEDTAGAGTTGTTVALDRYNTALEQAQANMIDTYQDSPIEAMGGEIGDAFLDVIRQQREVGKQLSKELEQYGNLKVSIEGAITNGLKQMSDSGLSFNPRTNQFTSFQGNAFAEPEINQLTEFFAKVRLLGDSPTVKQINDFVTRTNSELDLYKASANLTTTTNAERIIKTTLHNLKESLNPEVNGITQLTKYWDANNTYGKLKTFTKEGEKFLGKRTQTGDFARDASVAKSAVQSILNGGKKDWLIALEELTGYPALDNAVIALQAMKDAGDYKGLSLLQAIKDQGVPTSKAGLVGAIIDKAADSGKRALLGAPEEQTRAFLKSLADKGIDLKTPSRPIKAPADVPRTKELAKIEKDIQENVAAQKKAIAKEDWPLVAKLKEAYQKLKAALNAEIKRIKGGNGPDITNNPQGGFFNLGEMLQSIFGKKKVPRSEVPARIAEAQRYIRRQEKRIDQLIANGVKADSRQIRKIEEQITKVARERDALIRQRKKYDRRTNRQSGHIGGDQPNSPKLRSESVSSNKSSTKVIGTPEPELQTKREVIAKDLAGNKITVPKGTVLKPFNKDNKFTFKVGGKQYTVNKNQYQNLVGQSDVAKASPFAPELKGTVESVRGTGSLAELDKVSIEKFGKDFSNISVPERQEIRKLMPIAESTKYSQYTLPNGKDYSEIVVQAPDKSISYQEALDKVSKREIGKPYAKATAKQQTEIEKLVLNENAENVYKSSHWEEPNPLFHIRRNTRDWNGKKVEFMEEAQSDWARDVREKGTQGSLTPENTKYKDHPSGNKELFIIELPDGSERTFTRGAYPTHKSIVDDLNKAEGVPNHPLLKNWQIPATKRALMEAVDRDADIFAWINGAQTSERYKLSTQVESVKWNKDSMGNKGIILTPKENNTGGYLSFTIEDSGKIITTGNGVPGDWKGKKLDEVLGKGMADSIMSKPTGTLEGEGLNFGGEWANNLYDKQIRDIVKKLTGAEVKKADMGLALGKNDKFTLNDGNDAGGFVEKRNLNVGLDISDSKGVGYIVTEVGEGGKFKAVQKSSLDEGKKGYGLPSFIAQLRNGNPNILTEVRKYEKEFDIGPKVQTQQYIELTPEVKAKIKSEAPKFKMKNPSAGEQLPLILLMLGGGTIAAQQ